MSRRDLDYRIQRMLDGKLDPEERESLLGEIDRDPELLELYWDYVVLHGAFDRLSKSTASLADYSDSASESTLVQRRKRQLKWSLLATAAVLALVAVVLQSTLIPPAPPAASLRTSPGSALEVFHASSEDEAPPSGVMQEGSRAKLTSGSLELSFANGVQAIVRGPADLTLQAEDRLHLQEGTAWFQVPAEAVGFEVRTEELTVVDLGTEFGVRSLVDRPDEVHVFKGEVEARVRNGKTPPVVLGAGKARTVLAGMRLEEIESDSSHFLQALPDSMPYLHWSFDEGPDFAAAKGGHPAAGDEASRFEGLENEQAFGRGTGRFGEALVATGAVAEATSGWSGVLGDAPRTIAHWIKLTPNELGTQVIAGWGSHNYSPYNWNPAFLTYLRRVEGSAVAGVSFGAYHLDGTTPLNDDEWHHLAVVYTGRLRPNGEPELTCYLDGRPETMVRKSSLEIVAGPDGKVTIDTATFSRNQDAIPVTLFPDGWDVPRPRHMPLSIDELYIFETALDEGQVKRLYQHNLVR